MNFIIVNPLIEAYIEKSIKPETPLLAELRQETIEKMPASQMLSGPVVGRLLKLLVGLSRAKTVLEIGMYTGYSALNMAEAMPSDGKLYTCEIDEKAIHFAKRYFDKSPHGKKIEILVGPAQKSIDKLDAILDFVFIDADKAQYLNYYKSVLPKVRSGGLIVFDNSLRYGNVLHPKTEDEKIIALTNKQIAEDNNVDNVFLSIRDGVNIVQKK